MAGAAARERGTGPTRAMARRRACPPKPPPAGKAIVRNTPREHNVPNLRDRLPGSFGKTGYTTDASAVFGGVGLMSMRGMVAMLASVLLVTMFANAASQKNTMRITVLDSETRALPADDNGVPKNCDVAVTFDAYCRSGRAEQMMSTLLVQEDNQPPFRISCKIESRSSPCRPLPKGETFDARREKHGIIVYYADDNGKVRSELYRLVDMGGKAVPQATAAAVATQPGPAAAGNAGPAPAAPVPQTAAPVQSSPTPASAPHSVAPSQSSPAPAPVQSVAAQGVPKEKVRCKFNSTPPGADITIDSWKYVGSTPSEISLSTGTHVVVISMPGFAEWKRELTVEPDSVVNVTAVLQKTQP